MKLQETPDEIPDGGTPHTVSILMHDKLVDIGKPGDRVEVSECLCILLSYIRILLCRLTAILVLNNNLDAVFLVFWSYYHCLIVIP